MQFLNKFRRITSQGNYMPEVDGLRFLAISMVVIFHANGFFIAKSSVFYNDDTFFHIINSILHTWDKGVELFFIISGFILALPFANQILMKGKKVNLKSFYLRRITRLEPPYILTIVILFSLLIITKTYAFSVLFPSLLASLTYTHNIIFGVPLIATVAWSLEIEIQFYMIAPLISKIYHVEKVWRRLIMVLFIFASVIVQYLFPMKVLTLYVFIQYFLTGFLLADVYVSKDVQPFAKSGIPVIAAGILMILIILLTDLHKAPYGAVIFLTAAFLLYYLVLCNPLWKKFFSVSFLATVGGMCYSIYLWHFALISAFGRYLVVYSVSPYYMLNLTVFCIMVFIPVLLFSGLFFFYIEKPCMAKNWHRNLLAKIRVYGSKPFIKLRKL